MLSHFISLVIAYILGALTFIFFVMLFLYSFTSGRDKPARLLVPSDLLEEEKEEAASHPGYFYKVGWLRVTRDQKQISRSTSIGGIVKSYLSGSSGANGGPTVTKSNTRQDSLPVQMEDRTYFAVLKFNTLYLYDSELQMDCKDIVNISNHTVHIYPYGLKDFELFGKMNRIQLKKKKSLLLMNSLEKDYYFNCSRNIEKEDWYIALKRASKLNLSSNQQGEPATKDLQSSLYNSTHFNQDAMNHLITTIHSDPNHFEIQWLNALLGRVFLGIYKTDRTKSFFYNKILTKVAKLNARRPPFLEEISVRSVDGGHGAPVITQPRLIHLSPQGEYTGDAHVIYDGHFRVELETILKWKYSDRLPPIRIDLVLAITLKSIQGKMMFKIKEPPTNRLWLGFYKKPKMEWIIEPLVWEKRMGYSVVSNAIQTKIEEIITETMVLPNMDDMVFFQTEGVGGIYGEEDNYGKSSNSAFDLERKKAANSSSLEDKNVATSNTSSLSYQSLPELYSSPSELVVTVDSFPLLSTSVSSTIATPASKSWFKKRNKSYTRAIREHRQYSDLEDNSDSHPSSSPSLLDTPSQQTLKSVISPIINPHESSKRIKNINTKIKRKKSIIDAATINSRAQFLATNVDHSLQSLLLSTKATSTAETPTVQGSEVSCNEPANKSMSETSLDTKTVLAKPDASQSIRLSKNMLLLVDHRPSRLRSKSLPSTGLSTDVAQMGLTTDSR